MSEPSREPRGAASAERGFGGCLALAGKVILTILVVGVLLVGLLFGFCALAL